MRAHFISELITNNFF